MAKKKSAKKAPAKKATKKAPAKKKAPTKSRGGPRPSSARKSKPKG